MSARASPSSACTRESSGHALRAGHSKPVLAIMGVVARVFRMNSSLEQATLALPQAATGTAQTGTFFDERKIGASQQARRTQPFAVSCGSC